jgi:hypothetical protein
MICVAAGVYRPPEKQGQDAKDHKMSIFSDCGINYIHSAVRKVRTVRTKPHNKNAVYRTENKIHSAYLQNLGT